MVEYVCPLLYFPTFMLLAASAVMPPSASGTPEWGGSQGVLDRAEGDCSAAAFADFELFDVGDPVSIPDLNLEIAIRDTLAIPAPAPITEGDMATLTTLSTGHGALTPDGLKVSDLTGLEYAVNLNELILTSDLVTDLTPISGLTSLTVLMLDANPLASLDGISALTNLEVLSLSQTVISDLSPLSGMHSLRELYLWATQVVSLNPIESLPNLERLYLYQSPIESLSPLTGLSALVELTLGGSEQTTDYDPISGLTGLERLTIRQGAVADLGRFSGLTGLTYLDISDDIISDLSPLEVLVNLEILSIENCWLEEIAPLGSLPHLYSVDLRNNLITDPTPLIGLTGLIIALEGNYLDITTGSSDRTTLDVLGYTNTVYYTPQRSGALPDFSTATYGGAGGVGTVFMSGTDAWSAVYSDPWITPRIGGSGTGDGSFGFGVEENLTPLARSGTIDVGGNTITITQGGTEYLYVHTGWAEFVSGNNAYEPVRWTIKAPQSGNLAIFTLEFVVGDLPATWPDDGVSNMRVYGFPMFHDFLPENPPDGAWNIFKTDSFGDFFYVDFGNNALPGYYANPIGSTIVFTWEFEVGMLHKDFPSFEIEIETKDDTQSRYRIEVPDASAPTAGVPFTTDASGSPTMVFQVQTTVGDVFTLQRTPDPTDPYLFFNVESHLGDGTVQTFTDTRPAGKLWCWRFRVDTP